LAGARQTELDPTCALFEFRSAEDLQIWLEPLRHRSMLRIQP
jgi:hypothetical protein